MWPHRRHVSISQQATSESSTFDVYLKHWIDWFLQHNANDVSFGCSRTAVHTRTRKWALYFVLCMRMHVCHASPNSSNTGIVLDFFQSTIVLKSGQGRKVNNFDFIW